MNYFLRLDVFLTIIAIAIIYIGHVNCTPLPLHLAIEESKGIDSHPIQAAAAAVNDQILHNFTIPTSLDMNESNEIILARNKEQLQQLRTSIEQIRQRANGFESSLQTISPYQMTKLTNAQLQHGSQNDLVALQHALLPFSHSMCSSLDSNAQSPCLLHGGFPGNEYEQAYKSITLLHLLRSLPQSQVDDFITGFLEHATQSDIAAFKRVLTISKNPRIHHIFGNDFTGNGGIIGRHMRRSPIKNDVHLHLHGSYPPEPIKRQNALEGNNVKAIVKRALQQIDVPYLVKRKFLTPLPQCTFKKRSFDDGNDTDLQKRKNANGIKIPAECNGHMERSKNH